MLTAVIAIELNLMNYVISDFSPNTCVSSIRRQEKKV